MRNEAEMKIVLVIMCLVMMTSCTPASMDVRDEKEVVVSRVRRVIGGSEVDVGDWPWLVTIQGKFPTLSFFGITIARTIRYCGASLLDDRWILTAAHCFSTDNVGSSAITPRYWHARLGENRLEVGAMERLRSYLVRAFGGSRKSHWYIHAEKIILHPKYNAKALWENDIALVKLREAVPADANEIPEIQPITLPSADEVRSGFPDDTSTCIMKGWGCTVDGGDVADLARQVTLPKVPDANCESFWRVDMKTRLCAGYDLASKGICSGDSGGPLVCRHGGRWVQAGIASFSRARHSGSVPGVFTRVTEYIDWIRYVIDTN